MAVLSRAVKKLAHSGRARDCINRQAHFQQDSCETSAEFSLPYPAGNAGLAIFERDLELAGQIPQRNHSRAAPILDQVESVLLAGQRCVAAALDVPAPRLEIRAKCPAPLLHIVARANDIAMTTYVIAPSGERLQKFLLSQRSRRALRLMRNAG